MNSVKALRNQQPSGAWAGYAACACSLLFSVPSFYWTFGGTVGLATVGSWAVRLSAEGNPWVLAGVGLTGALKVAVGVLALALVRPWGRLIPRWMMLTAGWTSAGVLTGYGLVQLVRQMLVLLGVYPGPTDMDRRALQWHLYLWSPWFVVLGILLTLAMWHYRRRDVAARRPD